jgi:hypothetical protein
MLATNMAVEIRRLIALGVACGVHVGLLLGVDAVRALASPPSEALAAVSEITLEELTPEPTPLPSAAADGADEAAGPARAAALAAKTAPRATSTAVLEAAPPESTPPAAAADDGWSFSPSAARIDLHGAVTPDMVAPPHDPAARDPRDGSKPATASATGGLAEGLAAHDLEVGMGRGGPVLAAAEAAARSSDAPLDGGATFDVAVRPDSVVARVVSADHDAAGWARVADSLGHSLDPKKMRLPEGGRGWHVVVHVDATMRLADGRDVRTLHGVKTSVTPSILQQQTEAKPGGQWAPPPPPGPDDAKDEPPHGGGLGRGPQHPGGGALQGLAQRILPTPTVSVSGKICSASLSATPFGLGLGGGCSLENIGTHATRVVSGRILSEGAL